MPVCQYFLSGRCRYGENCRNEHPRGGAQRNLFGGGDQNWQGREGPKVTFRDNYSVGGQSHSNPYKWSANNQQGQGSSNQQSTIDVLDDLPKSMEIWEQSKMWPFSCLSLDANIPSIPDFYDLSMEELRLDAYQALKTDTMQSYMKKYQTLQNEFANKRNQLKHMTMEMKRKLMSFLEDARKNNAASAGSTVRVSLTQSTLFGQSRSAQESGLFSQPSASSGLFGKPAGTGSVFGGNTLVTGSSFGQGASSFGNQGQIAFGNTSTAFGNTGTAFGNTGTAFGNTGTAFGNTGTAFGNTGTASSIFGSINVQSSSFGGAASTSFSNSGTNSSVFGSPGTSLFGKPVEQESIFGGQMAESSSILFGAVSQNSTLQTPSLFGGDSSIQAGLFGSVPQPQSGNPVGGLFNSAVSGTSGLFGNNTGGQQQASGVFGSSTNSSFFNNPPIPDQQTGTLFSNLQAQNVINQGGHQNSGGLFGKGSSVPSCATAANDASAGCYSLMSDLTDQEKEAFNAQAFQLGKIPLRPPPIELIRNK